MPKTAMLILLAMAAGFTGRIYAQVVPAATQTLRLSAFGGITGTYTGLDSGKNLGITGGIDLGFSPVFRFYPSLEVRGTLPMNGGHVDSQKNVLAGLRVSRPFGRLHPYVNILFGRGEIAYGNGYQVPGTPVFYTHSSSNVLSPGIGLDIDLSERFAFKVDAQFQRYPTPVTTSGHINAKAGTVGLVYRFDFNRRLW